MRTEAIFSSQFFMPIDRSGGNVPEQKEPTFEERLSHIEGLNRKFVPLVKALHQLNIQRAQSKEEAYTQAQQRAILSTAYLEVENPEKGVERAKLINTLGINEPQFLRDIFSLPDFIDEETWDEYEKLIASEKNKQKQEDRKRLANERAEKVKAQGYASLEAAYNDMVYEGILPEHQELILRANEMHSGKIANNQVSPMLQHLYRAEVIKPRSEVIAEIQNLRKDVVDTIIYIGLISGIVYSDAEILKHAKDFFDLTIPPRQLPKTIKELRAKNLIPDRTNLHSTAAINPSGAVIKKDQPITGRGDEELTQRETAVLTVVRSALAEGKILIMSEIITRANDLLPEEERISEGSAKRALTRLYKLNQLQRRKELFAQAAQQEARANDEHIKQIYLSSLSKGEKLTLQEITDRVNSTHNLSLSRFMTWNAIKRFVDEEGIPPVENQRRKSKKNK